MVTTTGLRDWLGEPGVARTECTSSRRESNLEGEVAVTSAALQPLPGIDGSKHQQYPGRPPVSSGVEASVVRMARENSGWGHDRIVGALANLGRHASDQTVGNILRRHGIAPATKRSQITPWKDFLAAHMHVLAGCDFFTVEVLTWRGLVTYYVPFFLYLESRRVRVAGITRHPDQAWMEQIACSATQDTWAIFMRVVTFCTIATRSSVLRFGRHWQLVESKRFRFRPEARI